MGTAPDFLDPQEGYTTQSAEATWISYTPLLTYRHTEGNAGTELIPGLAKGLPTVSKDGRTKVVARLIGVHASRRIAAQSAAILLNMRFDGCRSPSRAPRPEG